MDDPKTPMIALHALVSESQNPPPDMNMIVLNMF